MVEFTITAKDCRKMAQAIHDKLQIEQTIEAINDIQSIINSCVKRGQFSYNFYIGSCRYELVDISTLCKKLRKAGFKVRKSSSYGLFGKVDELIIKW